MAQATTKDLTTLPVGRLGLIPLISCKDLGEKVNEWLDWRIFTGNCCTDLPWI